MRITAAATYRHTPALASPVCWHQQQGAAVAHLLWVTQPCTQQQQQQQRCNVNAGRPACCSFCWCMHSPGLSCKSTCTQQQHSDKQRRIYIAGVLAQASGPQQCNSNLLSSCKTLLGESDAAALHKQTTPNKRLGRQLSLTFSAYRLGCCQAPPMACYLQLSFGQGLTTSC
jgi:hypothetical protein